MMVDTVLSQCLKTFPHVAFVYGDLNLASNVRPSTHDQCSLPFSRVHPATGAASMIDPSPSTPVDLRTSILENLSFMDEAME